MKGTLLETFKNELEPTTLGMRLLTIRQFSLECGCSYEAIRKKLGTEIIPTTENPTTIDADKYDYIIKTFQNKEQFKKK